MTEEEHAKLKSDYEALKASFDKLAVENKSLTETAAKQKTASEVAEAFQKKLTEKESELDRTKAEVLDLKKTISQLLNGSAAAKQPNKDGFMKSLNL